MHRLLMILILSSSCGIHSQIGFDTSQHETKDTELVAHSFYRLAYSDEHEQALWVSYILTRERAQGSIERTDKFMPDPLVSTESADEADYYKSGYDRGHLAPAGDMAFNEIAMKESFYYSNMSPQVPSFNRGVWKKLESHVRKFALQSDSLLILCGPVLDTIIEKIGPNAVSVPIAYYKIVLDYRTNNPIAYGYLLRNEKSNADLEVFNVSVDSIESRTQIDFFSDYPDDMETKIESATNHIVIEEGTLIDVNDNNTEIEAAQCTGFTSSGSRCKRKTTNENQRCYQHQP